ncbi:hypothetical protein V6N12_017810 [Hibiscus sabdariffa]
MKYPFPEQISASHVHKDVYFFDSKLHPGSKMDSKELTMEVVTAGFLPPWIANSIPFSGENFARILTYFSPRPESQILKEAIEICEMPALEGELKQCSTSFDAFVHSAVSLLGKHIQLLETKTSNLNFTVGDGIQVVAKSDIN